MNQLARVVATKTIDLNLHQSFRINEPRNPDESARRLNSTEDFAVSASGVLPTIDVREHHARSNDVFSAAAGSLDGLERDGETSLGLLVDISRMRRAAVGADRRCACNGNKRPGTNGSRKSNDRFQGRTG